mmetsp:Transcript_31801/g.57626  ORF Transcript_31801/g.57626 Transcript_31801/m.57626 type:complete len:414 (+) Transcript_31801:68-1309(+)
MGCTSSAQANQFTNIVTAEDTPTLLASPKSKNRKDTQNILKADGQFESPDKCFNVNEHSDELFPFEESDILQMIVSGCDDEKSILSSKTDAQLARKQVFGEKEMNARGNIADPSRSGLGFTCRKGSKPKNSKPNQDSWLILKTGTFSIYGVFDGHGPDGHRVSNFVKEVLPKLIVKTRAFHDESCRSSSQIEEMFKDVFKRLQSLIVEATKMSKIDAELSGCTTTIIIHDHATSKLYVAWVGDSGACIGKRTASGLVPVGLTWDHKPEVEEERMRIEKRGGQVINDRVWDKDHIHGLNMSRALGDIMGNKNAGISAEPSVITYDITPEDEVLLLCSDGIWTFVSFDEAVSMVGKFSFSQAGDAAEKLAWEARKRWRQNSSSVDDITALTIYLNPVEDSTGLKKPRTTSTLESI